MPRLDAGTKNDKEAESKPRTSFKVYTILLPAAFVFLVTFFNEIHVISEANKEVMRHTIPANWGVGVAEERTNATSPEGETETTAATDSTNATVVTASRNATTANDGCIPFIDSASNYDPTKEFLYRQSSKLPHWMKEYFDWHNSQITKINSCNYKDYRYLTLRCSNREKRCGGLSDRIKSLPFFIALAAKSKRIFMIRWQRPTKLEEFLLPNEIDWSFPDWMYNKKGFKQENLFYNSGKLLRRDINHNIRELFVEGKVQSFVGGSDQYYILDSELDDNKEYNETYVNITRDWAGWEDYNIIFHDLWHALFEPTPPIAKRIKDRMASAGLVSGNFSGSHYRAFYATEHKKSEIPKDNLKYKAENAINCASQGLPGHPIYFASDSQFAVEFARNMTSTHPGRKIVTFDSDKEALHIDKSDQWTSGNISDFYPIFVDLLIMAEAKCMAVGQGGFGMFASILSSDPSCGIAHEGRWAQKCEWTDPKESF